MNTFNLYFDKLSKENFTLLELQPSTTQNGYTLTIQCKKCASKYDYNSGKLGHVFKRGCIGCNQNDKFLSVVGSEYQLLSNYKDWQTKVTMKHTICGYEWVQIPGSILKDPTIDIAKQPCPKCRGHIHRTYEYLEKEIIDLTEGEYALCGSFNPKDKVTTRTKISVKHLVCGREWSLVLNNFTSNGHRCKPCNDKQRRHPAVDFDLYFDAYPEKKSIPTTIYLVEISNAKESFLKLGITTRSFKERRLCDGTDYKVNPIFIKQTSFEYAATVEQVLLEEVRDDKVEYKPKNHFYGFSECFITEYKEIVIDRLKQCFELLENPTGAISSEA